ncbi:hypothetical protein [Polaribacter filamentus]|nr:hypothetical protein [Polaribacter filamentus]
MGEDISVGVIDKEGFTPGFAEIIAPSQTIIFDTQRLYILYQ